MPLALAWGLVELAVRNDAVRFGGRLMFAAVAVVTSVILATDPLGGSPFGRAWPLTAAHFQVISRSALDAGQAVAVLAALACVSLVLAGRGLRPPLAAAVPPGLAVLMTTGLRIPIPARAAYPLLSAMAAVLVLFGASRIGEMPGRGERDERLDGVHDGGGRYRPDDDFRPGDAYRPAEGSPPAGQYASYGQRPGRPGPAPPAQPLAQPPQPQPPAPARPYGRIQIFTLLDDRAAEFDRLAEEAAELVSAGEPDTLVYVIHLVPNAPLQRIFYEIYRDRAAFDAHESQPYMQRFVAGRRSLVLATNVIELRLKYAKVAPLPAPQPSGAPQAAGQPQQAPPQRPPVPAGPPRPQPRPPARPQPPRPEPERYDRQGYDQERYHQERYEQERYEQERYEQRRPDPRPEQRPDQRPGPDPRQVRSAAGHTTVPDVPRITLLGRPGCHLCDDARAVIERIAGELGVGWEERDITTSPEDMREYWDKIPVTLVDGVQIDFWRVSEARLRAALSRPPGQPPAAGPGYR